MYMWLSLWRRSIPQYRSRLAASSNLYSPILLPSCPPRVRLVNTISCPLMLTQFCPVAGAVTLRGKGPLATRSLKLLPVSLSCDSRHPNRSQRLMSLTLPRGLFFLVMLLQGGAGACTLLLLGIKIPPPLMGNTILRSIMGMLGT